MPEPRKDETRSEYLDRCMGDAETNSKYPNPAQRIIVCRAKWTEAGGKGLPRRAK